MYKYKAFISYSHADIAFGRWLQKKIENYKIPKSLREKYPNLPKDLKRSVFRDEEELAIGANLPDKLTNALNQSEFLIVIASPNAVASEWVGKEIAYFKSYHGEDMVLTMMKEGEPSEAFPKALRYQVDEHGELTEIKTEPLAGDARKGKNKKMALMKLIAGILKVDFADLWEREDVEKRDENLKLVALALISLLIAILLDVLSFYTKFLLGVVFLALLVYAFRLKRAVSSNIELDKINSEIIQIEHRLTHKKIKIEERYNLNDKLKALKKAKEAKEDTLKWFGMLKTPIAQKAKEAYDKRGVDSALHILESAESINEDKEYAKKNILRAKLYIEKNMFEKSEEFYEKALVIDFSYSNVVEYAVFLYKQNSLQKAIELYQKLQEKRLSKEQKAGVLNNLASLQDKLNQNQEAIVSYQEALKLYKALADKNPFAYNFYVATTLNNLAVLQNKLNHNQEAMRSFQEALKLKRALAYKNPFSYNSDVAETLNNLAVLQDKLNDNQKALKNYREALKLKRTLADKNPSAYNSDMAMTLNNLALLQVKLNLNQEAMKSFLEALKLYRTLADKNPFAYNFYVATTLNNLAILQDKLNQNQEAMKSFQEALKLRRALADKNSSAYNSYVAETLNNLALLQDKLKQNQEAMNNYQEALKLRRELADKNPSAYGIDLANSLVMGVYLLNQPIDSLDEAEIILKKFRRISNVEWLLGKIKELRKKAK